jgi:hypothetical protein
MAPSALVSVSEGMFGRRMSAWQWTQFRSRTCFAWVKDASVLLWLLPVEWFAQDAARMRVARIVMLDG